MFIKHVLGAFAPATPCKYIVNGQPYKGINTVKDYINNGLTTYDDTHNYILSVVDNSVVIQGRD